MHKNTPFSTTPTHIAVELSMAWSRDRTPLIARYRSDVSTAAYGRTTLTMRCHALFAPFTASLATHSEAGRLRHESSVFGKLPAVEVDRRNRLGINPMLQSDHAPNLLELS